MIIFANDKRNSGAYNFGATYRYWSNSAGDLHLPMSYEEDWSWLQDASELPEKLREIYEKYWKEGAGCFEYLAQRTGNRRAFGLLLIEELGSEEDDGAPKADDELYSRLAPYAQKLSEMLDNNADIIVAKNSGFGGCHEFCVFLPYESVEKYADICRRFLYDEVGQTLKKAAEPALNNELMAIVDGYVYFKTSAQTAKEGYEKLSLAMESSGIDPSNIGLVKAELRDSSDNTIDSYSNK